jgi:methylthioribose-1-phosphate isomerase
LGLIKPIKFLQGKLYILDQTLLPIQEKWLIIETYLQMIKAIQNLSIRGAPLLGLAGIYGLYCAAKQASDYNHFLSIADEIRKVRPTAVNLSKIIDQELKKHANTTNLTSLKNLFLQDAELYEKELEKESLTISKNGFSLLQQNDCILTHCNTGSLATIGLGTALGVIKYAYSHGKNISVLFTETRPLLQGARLTSYELMKANIPNSMIADASIGFYMHQNKINKVIVGADRIAINGDSANKIGTYTIAVMAKVNSVPFYIAAPTSTIDPLISSGSEISIEYRNPEELNPFVKENRIKALNPAFDVTPQEYISGFITEKGILKLPFQEKVHQ